VKPFVRFTRYDDNKDPLLGIVTPKPNAPSVEASFSVERGKVLEGDTCLD